MQKKRTLSGALTAVCTVVIVLFVLIEAHVALRPHIEMSFRPPPIAYGEAFRNVFITGTVYNDEGKTPVGLNRVVAVTFGGGAIRGTGATTSTGFYTIGNLSHSGAGVVVTAFLQDAVEDAVTVTTLSGGDLRQFHLYRNRLIVRSDSGSFPLTNTHLDTGDNNGDTDIQAIYRMAGTKAATQSGKSLSIWSADTYKPGGNVSAGSGITLYGTFQPEGNTVTLSGSWAKKSSSTFTFATSTVTMNGTNQILSGATIFKNFTKIVTASDTLHFDAGLTQTFTGALTLRGAEAARLKLRSTTGTQWKLNPQSTRSVRFLDVNNARNTNATIIDCVTGCSDSGSNLLWNFGTFSVRGTVYSDEGTTAIGSNSIVAASMNGGARAATGVTTSTGFYLLDNLQYSGGLVLTVFLDNGADKAATTTILSSTGLTAYHLYKDRLILRADSGSIALTNTHLATADNVADADLLNVFHIDSSSALGSGSGKEIFVWTGDTYQPGGRVKTHDLDVRGTLTLGTNGLTASGSVAVSGTMTTSTGILLTSVNREILALTGVTLQAVTLDNGLWGYWKMDDGTGSLVRDSSRYSHPGTIAGIPFGSSSSGWVIGSTGTTLFYNASALLFDGTSDFVNIGDALNPDDRQDFTVTAWVNRSSFSGKHTILAKKAGSGASLAGYALWMDDATDTLQFAASDGTDDYTLKSTSTFVAAGWHHIAVVWDQDSASKTEIYVNGTANSATDTGTIGNVNDLSSSQSLRIGAESDGERSFHGKIDDVRIYRRELSPSEIRTLAQGNKATGSGVYTLGSTLDINGDLRIYGGTIDVSAANKTITAAGNIDNQGGFERGSGTFTLDGTNQTVSGSTMFNVFRKIATSAVTLYLDFTSRQSVSGSLVLNGANASTKMSLRSTKSGSVARMLLDTAGVQSLQYLDVKDQSASGGALLACSTGCTDSGHNFRWSITTCGDGVVAGSEQCDNGDSNSNATDAACRTNCLPKRCGDGIKDAGEGCDDGNSSNSDACLNSCVPNTAGGGRAVSSSTTSYYKRPAPPPGCGNAILQKSKGEQCDEGRFNGIGTCSYNCKILFCGDGEVTVVIGEECEPTPSAGPNGERIFVVPVCGQVCTAPDAAGRRGCKINYLPVCGASASASSVDDHYDVSPPNPTAGLESFPPKFSALPPVCGDGLLKGAEQCDDGNVGDGDGCSALCVTEGGVASPLCGDRAVSASEECDDGNTDDGDGCSAFCSRETAITSFCGNAVIDAQEECDDGERNSNTVADACRVSCRKASCGDFVVDRGEECDQGPGNSSIVADRCRSDCRLPRCGDGVRDGAEDCDGSFGCNAYCSVLFVSAVCGNGQREDSEECDDGNFLNEDGCSRRCRKEIPRAPTAVADASDWRFDADVVVVNPTEIAVALKFLPDPDPCATVTASGEEADAAGIRAAAGRQGILIVKNVPLAQSLRAENPVGSTVNNPWCVQVNMLRSVPLPSFSASSTAKKSASSSAPSDVPIYRPIASFIPAPPVHAPVGDTGPGAVVLIGAAAAGAVGWIRRRKWNMEH